MPTSSVDTNLYNNSLEKKSFYENAVYSKTWYSLNCQNKLFREEISAYTIYYTAKHETEKAYGWVLVCG